MCEGERVCVCEGERVDEEYCVALLVCSCRCILFRSHSSTKLKTLLSETLNNRRCSKKGAFVPADIVWGTVSYIVPEYPPSPSPCHLFPPPSPPPLLISRAATNPNIQNMNKVADLYAEVCVPMHTLQCRGIWGERAKRKEVELITQNTISS